jgi:quinol monooxygenase YgiN
MEFPRAEAPAAEACCAVVELRQYTLKPGRRDDLIALFDRHFVEGQERDGARVLGQFADRRNPDRFVWLRGFADMESRRKALTDFYGGPIWKHHRGAANDTMVDTDDVLLLRPARPLSGLRLKSSDRPGLDAPQATPGLVTATIYSFASPVGAEFKEFFEDGVVPILRESGAALLGYFVTEASENTFPRLPVRTGENVFVWLASFADEAAYAAYRSRLADSQAWTQSLAPRLEQQLKRREEVLELLPTRRSLLRHSRE